MAIESERKRCLAYAAFDLPRRPSLRGQPCLANRYHVSKISGRVAASPTELPNRVPDLRPPTRTFFSLSVIIPDPEIMLQGTFAPCVGCESPLLSNFPRRQQLYYRYLTSTKDVSYDTSSPKSGVSEPERQQGRQSVSNNYGYRGVVFIKCSRTSGNQFAGGLHL